MQDCVLPVLKVKIVMLERLKLRPNDGNISQNCWPCICKLRPNDRNIHKSWMKNLTSFKFEPTILTSLNTSQQGGQSHATCCTQQCCICCVEMLRSFHRGLRITRQRGATNNQTKSQLNLLIVIFLVI